jgi:hypothetical protein
VGGGEGGVVVESEGLAEGYAGTGELGFGGSVDCVNDDVTAVGKVEIFPNTAVAGLVGNGGDFNVVVGGPIGDSCYGFAVGDEGYGELGGGTIPIFTTSTGIVAT